MFAVGFHEYESIEKIKLSIVDVVQKLDHWGEKLPHSWAMFENFFQEKKHLRIINKRMLLNFNQALPQELQLDSNEDIYIMLQFFNDIREILYIYQKFLSETIILDVQWFADAFKNVITDKNHAEKDLLEYATEWDKFDETGELSDTLLSAIWNMNNPEYFDHKDEIMLYMEKLGLFAKIGDNKWYVPCMNKRQFPLSGFLTYPASSILCFKFEILPVGIFHRLVAFCMQIPWNISYDGDQQCIYQTRAVFLFENHNILLGMTTTEIQLQVFVIEGKVDISTCHRIRDRVSSILNVLSKTFQTNSKRNVAFKCKTTGFCDGDESSVIDESEFTRSTFQCPSCPIEKMHIVNTRDIMKYWNPIREDEPPMSEARITVQETTEKHESQIGEKFIKILQLLQVGTDAVRICFNKFFPPTDLQNVLQEHETDLRSGKFRFQPSQLAVLYPTEDGSNIGVSSLSFDISIMYKLLRNYSNITPPGNGWGKDPKVIHITESDDIERIRLYRNEYSHESGSYLKLSDKVFSRVWTDISEAILRLSNGTLKRRISEI